MKKNIILVLFVLVMVACSSNNDNKRSIDDIKKAIGSDISDVSGKKVENSIEFIGKECSYSITEIDGEVVKLYVMSKEEIIEIDNEKKCSNKGKDILKKVFSKKDFKEINNKLSGVTTLEGYKHDKYEFYDNELVTGYILIK